MTPTLLYAELLDNAPARLQVWLEANHAVVKAAIKRGLSAASAPDPRGSVEQERAVRDAWRQIDAWASEQFANELAAAIRAAGGPENIRGWFRSDAGGRVYFPANAGYLVVGHDGSVSETSRGKKVFYPSGLFRGGKAAVVEGRKRYFEGLSARLAAIGQARVAAAEAIRAGRPWALEVAQGALPERLRGVEPAAPMPAAPGDGHAVRLAAGRKPEPEPEPAPAPAVKPPGLGYPNADTTLEEADAWVRYIEQRLVELADLRARQIDALVARDLDQKVKVDGKRKTEASLRRMWSQDYAITHNTEERERESLAAKLDTWKATLARERRIATRLSR